MPGLVQPLTRDRIRDIEEDDRAGEDGVQCRIRSEVDESKDYNADCGQQDRRDGYTALVHD
jgi:hypothetical protein